MKWEEAEKIIREDHTKAACRDWCKEFGHYCFHKGQIRFYRLESKIYETPIPVLDNSYIIVERKDLKTMKLEEALAVIRADRSKGMQPSGHNWYYKVNEKGELVAQDGQKSTWTISDLWNKEWTIVDIDNPRKKELEKKIKEMEEKLSEMKKEVSKLLESGTSDGDMSPSEL